MANWTEINNSFSKRMSVWTETPIAWDNVDYTPVKDQAWIRCTLLPSTTVNNELGPTSVINYGIFWVQIFVPKLTGTGRAYEIADMLSALFSNVQFDDIVCYASDVRRSGDTGHEWFQLNVRINYWSHERV